MKLIHMKHFPNVDGFVGFTLHLSFLIVVFDNKGQYLMLIYQLSRIDKGNPHVSCVTHITICRLVNFTAFIIILPLFIYLILYPYFCISCHYRH